MCNSCEIKTYSKACVIAGNGPSLANIDYSLLPKDFEVFRANQFFFEDKYFLGKSIKCAFINGIFNLPTSHLTLHTLKQKDEYKIDYLMCIQPGVIVGGGATQNTLSFFPDVMDGCEYIKMLSVFNNSIMFNYIHKDQAITTGVYMVAVAVALGYKELYIVGIDLYRDGGKYAFSMKDKPNFFSLGFDKECKPADWHNAQTDIDALKLLEKEYGVKIYILSESCPLKEYFPLAPRVNDLDSSFVKPKPTNFINDVVKITPKDLARINWVLSGDYLSRQDLAEIRRILKISKIILYPLVILKRFINKMRRFAWKS
ncbi:alpha-2,3-sialyltransferase [Helicobacter equorum]|uniref:alpha-2,3-sialyltransferase n=1 Tax=Helicobacter equorum TaxID=361872 RepID=UPI000CF1B564|nr:alpha-2,3-sialyltransferase [Helicobacter equorum]